MGLWPNQVADLTHRGLPKLGPWQQGPLEGARVEANQPLLGVGKTLPRTRVARCPLRARVGNHLPLIRAGNWPLLAEAGSKPPQGAPLICPQRGRELATVCGMTGTRGPSGGLKGEHLNPGPSLSNWDHTGEGGGCRPNLQPCRWQGTASKQFCLRGSTSLLSGDRGSDIEHLGLSDTLYDLRV